LRTDGDPVFWIRNQPVAINNSFGLLALRMPQSCKHPEFADLRMVGGFQGKNAFFIQV
jgi:hypothetical protein